MTERKQRGSDRSAGSKWVRRLSHLVALGALLLIASSALMAHTGRRRSGWYQLKSVLPGENVPNWLFTGRSYEGIPDETGTLVKVIAPETRFSHLVPVELLTEVDPPMA